MILLPLPEPLISLSKNGINGVCSLWYFRGTVIDIQVVAQSFHTTHVRLAYAHMTRKGFDINLSSSV